MNTTTYSYTYLVDESTQARLAFLSFGIYFFFVVFGTSMPFQDSLQERGEAGGIGTSNVLNQLLSLLFLVSAISLWGKQNVIFSFILREKFLFLFLGWAFLSIFWSPQFSVSLKRWITLFGEVIICLAALLHFRWSEVGLRPMRVIFLIYFPLTILAILLVPAAIQWEFPAWRGLAPTKNNLGQIALFGIIAWLSIISYHRGRGVNLLHYAMLFLAFIAYVGARSTTSFLVGVFLLAMLGIVQVGKMVANRKLAVVFAAFMTIGAVLVVYIVTRFMPEITGSILGAFGKDLSFTGRVDLWETVFAMTKSKVIQGWGIGGFWVMDSLHIIPVHQKFVWLPNQAHQGYLDVYNQVGIVGFSLMLMMIVNYLRSVKKLKKKTVWIWFFIGILIFNFQESLFFRPRHIGHFLFVFVYMALFVDLLKQRRASEGIYR